MSAPHLKLVIDNSEQANEPQLEVYSSGPCYCSVCTNIEGLEEITDRLNVEQPTRINSGWRLADEPFRGGQTNPCPCECDDRVGFKHYLFSC